MKKKAELIEDVEKAEKLAQHWKRKADKYLDKLQGSKILSRTPEKWRTILKKK